MKTISFAKKALAVAILSTAAIGAQAATTNLGTLAVGSTTLFEGTVQGPFLDLFTFILPANGGTGYTVQDLPFSFFGSTYSTAFTNFALVSNLDGVIGSTDDMTVQSLSSVGASQLDFMTAPLTAGSYYLAVSGVTNGTAGGKYVGLIGVAPVPEPESYAMFLAGLGVMGAIAARRSKAKKG